MKVRVHLRHIGTGRPRRPGYTRGDFRGNPLHWNIYLGGPYYIAVRPLKHPEPLIRRLFGQGDKAGFFDLGMGRAMLRYQNEEQACPWPGTDHFYGICACPNKRMTRPNFESYETRMRDHILTDHGATLHPPGPGDGKAIGGTDEDAYLLHSIYFPNCQEWP